VTLLVLLAVVAAGITVLALNRGHPGPSARPPDGLTGAAATRGQAARWVARQVSHAAIAACDPAMCAALQAAGVPAADLDLLSAGTADPLGADIVVATSAVRSQFGSRLATVYAPAVLARFGAGTAQIDIRVVAAGGSTAYSAALGRDAAARKSTGAQLLRNARLQLAAPARAQLAAGHADSRLMLLLAPLAAAHSVRILSFGDAGPGADPSMPLRSAVLSGADPTGAMKQSAYAAWLLGALRGQRPPYAAQISAAQVQGHPVVDLQFTAPSPLGLIQDGG
jgi:hypothetical protein